MNKQVLSILVEKYPDYSAAGVTVLTVYLPELPRIPAIPV